MPTQKPGKSIQDYATPVNFIRAVKARWGSLDLDLAATPNNAKASRYITPEQNSLSSETKWDVGPHVTCWLNPPFGRIEPWVRKVAEHGSHAQLILMLIPAAVGSNWWATHVHDRCIVHLLRPRLSFDGKAPYPKDCALLEYSHRIGRGEKCEMKPSYECWKWM
jgi:phage N-6-adenine-methyltransferase